jgi:CelD/BcsL family acetyltransferase involved in cellulose biosynthesis
VLATGADHTTVDLESGLTGVAAEIDDLADRSGASPFARPDWFEPFLRAFGGADRLVVATARRDGRLAAALPLLRGRGSLTSPTNWHTPAYGPVAEDSDAAATLARAVVAWAPSVLDLSFLDPAGPFTLALDEAVQGAGRRVIRRPVLRSPYVPLDADYAAFEKTLPSKFRREVNRRRRKLEELGRLEIVFEDGRERLVELLDDGFAVEGSGWKTAEGTAIASQPETERFYREVSARAAEQGWLQLGFVRLDGRCLAFSLMIALGDTVHVVKVGFDPEWRKYAPGTLLTRAAIERAFEQGRARYDFLGGEDAYKLDWTDAVGERVRIQAFGRTPFGLASYVGWQHGRPLIKSIQARRGQ